MFAKTNKIHNTLFLVDSKSGDNMHIEYLIKEVMEVSQIIDLLINIDMKGTGN